MTSKLDFELFKRVYVRVEGSERPLRLFVRGYPYKLLFFIDADMHLIGTGDPDVRWFPLGTDSERSLSVLADGARLHPVAVDRHPGDPHHLGAGHH